MTRIETKLPVDFVMRSIILTMIFGGFVVYGLFFDSNFHSNIENYEPLLLIIPFLIIISLLDLYLRRGYSVLYDNERIYWRKVGLSRDFINAVNIKFGDIKEVYAIGEHDMAGLFEAVVLSSGNNQDSDIILSTKYIRDVDLSELLSKVMKLSAAKFDDEVSAFMQGA